MQRVRLPVRLHEGADLLASLRARWHPVECGELVDGIPGVQVDQLVRDLSTAACWNTPEPHAGFDVQRSRDQADPTHHAKAARIIGQHKSPVTQTAERRTDIIEKQAEVGHGRIQQYRQPPPTLHQQKLTTEVLQKVGSQETRTGQQRLLT